MLQEEPQCIINGVSSAILIVERAECPDSRGQGGMHLVRSVAQTNSFAFKTEDRRILLRGMIGGVVSMTSRVDGVVHDARSDTGIRNPQLTLRYLGNPYLNLHRLDSPDGR
jgi:hypothetical protein